MARLPIPFNSCCVSTDFADVMEHRQRVIRRMGRGSRMSRSPGGPSGQLDSGLTRRRVGRHRGFLTRSDRNLAPAPGTRGRDGLSGSRVARAVKLEFPKDTFRTVRGPSREELVILLRQRTPTVLGDEASVTHAFRRRRSQA